ncbi:MAG: GNAT family N-acetyltransferase [Cellulosilyticaceae bacterium]
MKVLKLDKSHLNDFVDMRISLFRELGEVSETEDIAPLRLSTMQYFLSHIDQDLLCWAVVVDEKIVSIASLNLFSRIPYLENLSGREGYILNIYTLPDYRKRGLAGKLVNSIIDYAKENEIKRLWLNSSEQGKSVYTSCGFEEVENAMELYLK